MEVNSLKINERIAALENMKMQILWENPNPKVEFPAQVITLSSDDYDFLDIYAYGVVNGTVVVHTRLLRGWNAVMHQPVGEAEGEQLGYRMRTFNYYQSYTTYTIGSGLFKLAGTTTAAVVRNEVLIPYRVIGVKGF